MLKNGSNPQNKVESLPFSFKWSEGIAPSPNLMILRHPHPFCHEIFRSFRKRRLANLESVFQWICRVDQICSDTCQVSASGDHRNNRVVIGNLCCLFDHTFE